MLMLRYMLSLLGAVAIHATTNNLGENIAIKGKAVQSSTFYFSANNAIDNVDFYCTNTKTETNPWWRLDLLDLQIIQEVVVTTRMDCCFEQINGAEIRIGNSLENNGNNNTKCAVISAIPAGQSVSYSCGGMQGRYLNVVIPGDSKQLTLCEVRVYGNDRYWCMTTQSLESDLKAYNVRVWSLESINMMRDNNSLRDVGDFRSMKQYSVKLSGRAVQSSILEYFRADRAIDGIKYATGPASFCTHTNSDSNPWWRLDLLDNYYVSTVVITNRADCCPERLDGAEIRIGNSLENNGNSNPICAVITSVPAGASYSYSCPDMEGRYVNIIIPVGRYLTLCEVEVYTSFAAVNFVRMKFTSNSDLAGPENEKLLYQLQSALEVRGITKIKLSWIKPPQREMKQDIEEGPCQRIQ